MSDKIPMLKLGNSLPIFRETSMGAFKIVHTDDEKFTPHRHGFTEIVVVQKGSGLHWIGDDAFPVSPGMVFAVPPRKVHRFENYSLLSLLTVNISLRMLGSITARMSDSPEFVRMVHDGTSREAPPFSVSSQDLCLLGSLVDRMSSEQFAKMAEYRLLQEALMLQFMVTLARSTHAGGTCFHGSRVAEIIGYMEKNLQHGITLDELSRRFGLCKTNLNLIFRRETGCSPIDWLLRTRIRKARELLENSTMSISEIAIGCGFCDASYFTRQFRRLNRISPHRYRKGIHGVYWDITSGEVRRENDVLKPQR